MSGKSSGVRLRPATREDISAIVMVSNSSTGEEDENDWARSIGAGVREIRMRKEMPRTNEVLLREVAETDLPIFFEHQRDAAANYMAAFTARDPNDKEAFTAHWKRILHDDAVTV